MTCAVQPYASGPKYVESYAPLINNSEEFEVTIKPNPGWSNTDTLSIASQGELPPTPLNSALSSEMFRALQQHIEMQRIDSGHLAHPPGALKV